MENLKHHQPCHYISDNYEMLQITITISGRFISCYRATFNLNMPNSLVSLKAHHDMQDLLHTLENVNNNAKSNHYDKEMTQKLRPSNIRVYNKRRLFQLERRRSICSRNYKVKNIKTKSKPDNVIDFPKRYAEPSLKQCYIISEVLSLFIDSCYFRQKAGDIGHEKSKYIGRPKTWISSHKTCEDVIFSESVSSSRYRGNYVLSVEDTTGNTNSGWKNKNLTNNSNRTVKSRSPPNSQQKTKVSAPGNRSPVASRGRPLRSNRKDVPPTTKLSIDDLKPNLAHRREHRQNRPRPWKSTSETGRQYENAAKYDIDTVHHSRDSITIQATGDQNRQKQKGAQKMDSFTSRLKPRRQAKTKTIEQMEELTGLADLLELSSTNRETEIMSQYEFHSVSWSNRGKPETTAKVKKCIPKIVKGKKRTIAAFHDPKSVRQQSEHSNGEASLHSVENSVFQSLHDFKNQKDVTGEKIVSPIISFKTEYQSESSLQFKSKLGNGTAPRANQVNKSLVKPHCYVSDMPRNSSSVWKDAIELSGTQCSWKSLVNEREIVKNSSAEKRLIRTITSPYRNPHTMRDIGNSQTTYYDSHSSHLQYFKCKQKTNSRQKVLFTNVKKDIALKVKRMVESYAKYLQENGVLMSYMHSLRSPLDDEKMSDNFSKEKRRKDVSAADVSTKHGQGYEGVKLKGIKKPLLMFFKNSQSPPRSLQRNALTKTTSNSGREQKLLKNPNMKTKIDAREPLHYKKPLQVSSRKSPESLSKLGLRAESQSIKKNMKEKNISVDCSPSHVGGKTEITKKCKARSKNIVADYLTNRTKIKEILSYNPQINNQEMECFLTRLEERGEFLSKDMKGNSDHIFWTEKNKEAEIVQSLRLDKKCTRDAIKLTADSEDESISKECDKYAQKNSPHLPNLHDTVTVDQASDETGTTVKRNIFTNIKRNDALNSLPKSQSTSCVLESNNKQNERSLINDKKIDECALTAVLQNNIGDNDDYLYNSCNPSVILDSRTQTLSRNETCGIPIVELCEIHKKTKDTTETSIRERVQINEHQVLISGKDLPQQNRTHKQKSSSLVGSSLAAKASALCDEWLGSLTSLSEGREKDLLTISTQAYSTLESPEVSRGKSDGRLPQVVTLTRQTHETITCTDKTSSWESGTDVVISGEKLNDWLSASVIKLPVHMLKPVWNRDENRSEVTSSPEGRHSRPSPVLTDGGNDSSKSTMKDVSELTFTSIESLNRDSSTSSGKWKDVRDIRTFSDTALVLVRARNNSILNEYFGQNRHGKHYSDISIYQGSMISFPNSSSKRAASLQTTLPMFKSLKGFKSPTLSIPNKAAEKDVKQNMNNRSKVKHHHERKRNNSSPSKEGEHRLTFSDTFETFCDINIEESFLSLSSISQMTNYRNSSPTKSKKLKKFSSSSSWTKRKRLATDKQSPLTPSSSKIASKSPTLNQANSPRSTPSFKKLITFWEDRQIRKYKRNSRTSQVCKDVKTPTLTPKLVKNGSCLGVDTNASVLNQLRRCVAITNSMKDSHMSNTGKNNYTRLINKNSSASPCKTKGNISSYKLASTLQTTDAGRSPDADSSSNIRKICLEKENGMIHPGDRSVKKMNKSHSSKLRPYLSKVVLPVVNLVENTACQDQQHVFVGSIKQSSESMQNKKFILTKEEKLISVKDTSGLKQLNDEPMGNLNNPCNRHRNMVTYGEKSYSQPQKLASIGKQNDDISNSNRIMKSKQIDKQEYENTKSKKDSSSWAYHSGYNDIKMSNNSKPCSKETSPSEFYMGEKFVRSVEKTIQLSKDGNIESQNLQEAGTVNAFSNESVIFKEESQVLSSALEMKRRNCAWNLEEAIDTPKDIKGDRLLGGIELKNDKVALHTQHLNGDQNSHKTDKKEDRSSTKLSKVQHEKKVFEHGHCGFGSRKIDDILHKVHDLIPLKTSIKCYGEEEKEEQEGGEGKGERRERKDRGTNDSPVEKRKTLDTDNNETIGDEGHRKYKRSGNRRKHKRTKEISCRSRTSKDPIAGLFLGFSPSIKIETSDTATNVISSVDEEKRQDEKSMRRSNSRQDENKRESSTQLIAKDIIKTHHCFNNSGRNSTIYPIANQRRRGHKKKTSDSQSSSKVQNHNSIVLSTTPHHSAKSEFSTKLCSNESSPVISPTPNTRQKAFRDKKDKACFNNPDVSVDAYCACGAVAPLGGNQKLYVQEDEDIEFGICSQSQRISGSEGMSLVEFISAKEAQCNKIQKLPPDARKRSCENTSKEICSTNNSSDPSTEYNKLTQVLTKQLECPKSKASFRQVQLNTKQARNPIKWHVSNNPDRKMDADCVGLENTFTQNREPQSLLFEGSSNLNNDKSKSRNVKDKKKQSVARFNKGNFLIPKVSMVSNEISNKSTHTETKINEMEIIIGNDVPVKEFVDCFVTGLKNRRLQKARSKKSTSSPVLAVGGDEEKSDSKTDADSQKLIHHKDIQSSLIADLPKKRTNSAFSKKIPEKRTKQLDILSCSSISPIRRTKTDTKKQPPSPANSKLSVTDLASFFRKRALRKRKERKFSNFMRISPKKKDSTSALTDSEGANFERPHIMKRKHSNRIQKHCGSMELEKETLISTGRISNHRFSTYLDKSARLANLSRTIDSREITRTDLNKSERFAKFCHFIDKGEITRRGPFFKSPILPLYSHRKMGVCSRFDCLKSFEHNGVRSWRSRLLFYSKHAENNTTKPEIKPGTETEKIQLFAPCSFPTEGKSVNVLVEKNEQLGYQCVNLSLRDEKNGKEYNIAVVPRDKNTLLSPKVETSFGYVHVDFYTRDNSLDVLDKRNVYQEAEIQHMPDTHKDQQTLNIISQLKKEGNAINHLEPSEGVINEVGKCSYPANKNIEIVKTFRHRKKYRKRSVSKGKVKSQLNNKSSNNLLNRKASNDKRSSKRDIVLTSSPSSSSSSSSSHNGSQENIGYSNGYASETSSDKQNEDLHWKYTRLANINHNSSPQKFTRKDILGQGDVKGHAIRVNDTGFIPRHSYSNRKGNRNLKCINFSPVRSILSSDVSYQSLGPNVHTHRNTASIHNMSSRSFPTDSDLVSRENIKRSHHRQGSNSRTTLDLISSEKSLNDSHDHKNASLSITSSRGRRLLSRDSIKNRLSSSLPRNYTQRDSNKTGSSDLRRGIGRKHNDYDKRTDVPQNRHRSRLGDRRYKVSRNKHRSTGILLTSNSHMNDSDLDSKAHTDQQVIRPESQSEHHDENANDNELEYSQRSSNSFPYGMKSENSRYYGRDEVGINKRRKYSKRRCDRKQERYVRVVENETGLNPKHLQHGRDSNYVQKCDYKGSNRNTEQSDFLLSRGDHDKTDNYSQRCLPNQKEYHRNIANDQNNISSQQDNRQNERGAKSSFDDYRSFNPQRKDATEFSRSNNYLKNIGATVEQRNDRDYNAARPDQNNKSSRLDFEKNLTNALLFSPEQKEYHRLMQKEPSQIKDQGNGSVLALSRHSFSSENRTKIFDRHPENPSPYGSLRRHEGPTDDSDREGYRKSQSESRDVKVLPPHDSPNNRQNRWQKIGPASTNSSRACQESKLSSRRSSCEVSYKHYPLINESNPCKNDAFRNRCDNRGGSSREYENPANGDSRENDYYGQDGERFQEGHRLYGAISPKPRMASRRGMLHTNDVLRNAASTSRVLGPLKGERNTDNSVDNHQLSYSGSEQIPTRHAKRCSIEHRYKISCDLTKQGKQQPYHSDTVGMNHDEREGMLSRQSDQERKSCYSLCMDHPEKDKQGSCSLRQVDRYDQPLNEPMLIQSQNFQREDQVLRPMLYSPGGHRVELINDEYIRNDSGRQLQASHNGEHGVGHRRMQFSLPEQNDEYAATYQETGRANIGQNSMRMSDRFSDQAQRMQSQLRPSAVGPSTSEDYPRQNVDQMPLRSYSPNRQSSKRFPDRTLPFEEQLPMRQDVQPKAYGTGHEISTSYQGNNRGFPFVRDHKPSAPFVRGQEEQDTAHQDRFPNQTQSMEVQNRTFVVEQVPRDCPCKYESQPLSRSMSRSLFRNNTNDFTDQYVSNAQAPKKREQMSDKINKEFASTDAYPATGHLSSDKSSRPQSLYRDKRQRKIQTGEGQDIVNSDRFRDQIQRWTSHNQTIDNGQSVPDDFLNKVGAQAPSQYLNSRYGQDMYRDNGIFMTPQAQQHSPKMRTPTRDIYNTEYIDYPTYQNKDSFTYATNDRLSSPYRNSVCENVETIGRHHTPESRRIYDEEQRIHSNRDNDHVPYESSHRFIPHSSKARNGEIFNRIGGKNFARSGGVSDKKQPIQAQNMTHGKEDAAYQDYESGPWATGQIHSVLYREKLQESIAKFGNQNIAEPSQYLDKEQSVQGSSRLHGNGLQPAPGQRQHNNGVHISSRSLSLPHDSNKFTRKAASNSRGSSSGREEPQRELYNIGHGTSSRRDTGNARFHPESRQIKATASFNDGLFGRNGHRAKKVETSNLRENQDEATEHTYEEDRVHGHLGRIPDYILSTYEDQSPSQQLQISYSQGSIAFSDANTQTPLGQDIRQGICNQKSDSKEYSREKEYTRNSVRGHRIVALSSNKRRDCEDIGLFKNQQSPTSEEAYRLRQCHPEIPGVSNDIVNITKGGTIATGSTSITFTNSCGDLTTRKFKRSPRISCPTASYSISRSARGNSVEVSPSYSCLSNNQSSPFTITSRLNKMRQRRMENRPFTSFEKSPERRQEIHLQYPNLYPREKYQNQHHQQQHQQRYAPGNNESPISNQSTHYDSRHNQEISMQDGREARPPSYTRDNTIIDERQFFSSHANYYPEDSGYETPVKAVSQSRGDDDGDDGDDGDDDEEQRPRTPRRVSFMINENNGNEENNDSNDNNDGNDMNNKDKGKTSYAKASSMKVKSPRGHSPDGGWADNQYADARYLSISKENSDGQRHTRACKEIPSTASSQFQSHGQPKKERGQLQREVMSKLQLRMARTNFEGPSASDGDDHIREAVLNDWDRTVLENVRKRHLQMNKELR